MSKAVEIKSNIKHIESNGSLSSISSFASSSKSYDSFSEFNTLNDEFKEEEKKQERKCENKKDIMIRKKENTFFPIRKRREREKEVISKSPQIEDIKQYLDYTSYFINKPKQS
tara:strand:+ start:3754 stop:4092 length:339 start_codon:yes stop_codon:yes gene_type:complete